MNPVSLIDELQSVLKDTAANRQKAHDVINANFDAIDASVKAAIQQITAFSQPTPPQQS